MILGTPSGHEDFVRAQLEHIVDEHNVLLERTPSIPDVQSAKVFLKGGCERFFFKFIFEQGLFKKVLFLHGFLSKVFFFIKKFFFCQKVFFKECVFEREGGCLKGGGCLLKKVEGLFV